MAIVNVNAERTATRLIKPWLAQDSLIRDGRINFHPGAGYTSARDIYRQSMPRHWQEFQSLNRIGNFEDKKDQRLVLKTGRMVLECVAQARKAYIFGQSARGVEVEAAKVASLKGLDAYVGSVRSKNIALPSTETLGLPLADALSEYTGHPDASTHPQHAYIGMVGLGIRALADLNSANRGADFLMPMPGFSLKQEPERWDVASVLASQPQ